MSPAEPAAPAPSPVIREATPADHDALIACMDTVFHEAGGERVQEFDPAYWNWEYRDAPHGSVVVVAADSGGLCAYYHAVLQDLHVDGRAARVAMVQDVGTLASHRGRGVFREMGGLALEALRRRGVEFIYTFPNQKSLPSFVRNHGYTIVARVPVLVRSLDLGRALAERARLGSPGRAIGNACAAVLRWTRAGSTRLAAGERVETPETPPAELAGFELARGATGAIGLARAPEYLRWRFVASPHRRYRIHTLTRGGAARAYLVTRDAEILGSPVSLIMDLGHEPGEATALRRLIEIRAREEERAGRVASVAMCLGAERRLLERAGYLRIPERLNPRPFNLLVKDLANPPRPALLEPGRWRITLADWDVY
jgi:GNAT superfamily N-acetyltransferase